MIPSNNAKKNQSVHLYHRRTQSAPSTPTNCSSPTPHGEEQDYPPLPPSKAIHEDRAFFNSPQPTTKSLAKRRSRSNGSHRPVQPRVVYESPRLYYSDIVLFPASKHGPLYNASYLQTYESRYQFIKALQGASVEMKTIPNPTSGSQPADLSTLHIHYNMIHNRKVPPKAVQTGILPQCAQRIRFFHCPILPRRSSLVRNTKMFLKSVISWIDMMVHTFPNLEHLYIQPPPLVETNVTAEQTPIFTKEEMKLFYTFIIYRIPALQTIDGISITTQDRKEAMLLKRVKAAASDVHHMPLGSRPTRCSSSPNPNNGLPPKTQRVTSCLLDGMSEDEYENNNPLQKDNMRATETTVEGRQPSSEKGTSKRRPSKDRVIRSPDAYHTNRQFFENSKTKPEEEQWERVSVGESSVHAMGACASWTTACGSLSSALPYFLQKRAADPTRLKMKLLQNRKRMIQGNIPTTTNQNVVMHGTGKEPCPDFAPLERDQPTTQKSHSPSTKPKTPVPPSRSNLVRSMQSIPPPKSLLLQMQRMSEPNVIIGIPVPTVQESTKGVESLKITTSPVFTSQNSDLSCKTMAVPPTPRVSTSHARYADGDETLLASNYMEQGYDLTRTRSSPSKLPSFQSKAKLTTSLTVPAKSSALPPPCPGATRRKISAAVDRPTQNKNTWPIPSPLNIPLCISTTKTASLRHSNQPQGRTRMPQWRDAMSLRTFSLLDDDDDDRCTDGYVHSDDEDVLPLSSIRMS